MKRRKAREGWMQDSYYDRDKRNKSDQKVLDAIDGKRDLLATWQQCGNGDKEYLRKLRDRYHGARTRKKNKGL